MAKFGRDDLLETIAQSAALFADAGRDGKYSAVEVMQITGSLAIDAIEAFTDGGVPNDADGIERGYQRAVSAVRAATMDHLDERVEKLTAMRERIKESNPRRAERLTLRIERLMSKKTS